MFEDKRDLLLKEALNVTLENELKDDFKRRFFDLVNDVIIEMIEGEDNFFGSFMLKIERGIRLDITWPLATIPKLDGFIMYFNPILFLQNDKKEMAALFKHEIYHMMYFHYEREKSLKDKYSSEVVSIALDIAINQYIKNLPMDAKRIDSINREFNINLKSNRTADEYASKLQNEINRRINKEPMKNGKDSIARAIDITKAHDIWHEIEMSEEDIKELTKKTALGIKSDKVNDNIISLLKGYSEREELCWQDILKKFIPTVRVGHKKTITRRNRRQPDRLDLRGTLTNVMPEVLVAIDISASMTEDDIKKIMIEILAITKYRNNKITVLECDNKIRRVYELNSPKDIRRRSNNNGATEFTPVFKYIKDNNLRDNILIYFTDGVGEEELKTKPINRNILWVLTGDEELSLKKSYGKVVRIGTTKVKKDKNITGLSYMREVIHDWAR